MSRSTDHLVRDLADLGIRLGAEGDQLIVDAPRGVLTGELRATLTDHKTELLALLRRTHVPDDVECVPADKLTDLDQAAITAGRHAQADGTFPDSHRPRFDVGPPTHERVVNGVMVPAGWDVAMWATRLRYIADVCIHADRAAELRAWADRLEHPTKEAAR